MTHILKKERRTIMNENHSKRDKQSVSPTTCSKNYLTATMSDKKNGDIPLQLKETAKKVLQNIFNKVNTPLSFPSI